MQLVLNVRNVLVGSALMVAGYYGYRNFIADIQTKDVGTLFTLHRESEPARQLLIKRRILSIYASGRDYATVSRALDSPSPITQALAVEVLRDKGERQATSQLLQLLGDPDRADIVKEELARATGDLKLFDGIPRLVELTDIHEDLSVRASAHNALKALTGAGGEMKLSDATREHWTLMIKGHRFSVTN